MAEYIDTVRTVKELLEALADHPDLEAWEDEIHEVLAAHPRRQHERSRHAAERIHGILKTDPDAHITVGWIESIIVQEMRKQ